MMLKHLSIGILVMAVAAFAAFDVAPPPTKPATKSMIAAVTDTEQLTAQQVVMSPPILSDRPTAIFLTLVNNGQQNETLLAATSPSCGRIELHTHQEQNGVMRMIKVPSFEVPAGGQFDLQPMGPHLMCFEVDKNLQPGRDFDLTLQFKSLIHKQISGQVVDFDTLMANPKK